VLGSVAAPLALEYQAKKLVEERLNLEASFGEVRINPCIFYPEIAEFQLSDESDQLVSFEYLYLDFQLFN
jgi:hypothetical protein